MKAFDKLSYDDAKTLLGLQVPVDHPAVLLFPTNLRRPPAALTATQFYIGNHWQDSRGFIGQLPPATLPGASFILRDIEAGFVSENVIQEVVETHTGGILGREPVWSFLKEETTTNISEADRDIETGHTLTPWWNERHALRDLQKAATILLCEGRVIRRIFFPRGRLSTNNRISAPNISAALDYIFFETVTADKGGVFTDPDTQKDVGMFFFEERKADGEVIANCVELSFLNDSGQTVCKVVKDKGGPETYGPYELGGRLLIYELNRRALITAQVQSNQRALNLAHTMMMRNVNMAGSRERTVTNAQPPIDIVGTDVQSRSQARFPGTYKTGSGAVNFLMGVPIRNEEGEITGYTNPNVNITDPVSVETFVATSDHYRQAIYSQCHQRHVLIVDKADTSGRAREVARREFERSLKETKTVVDASGRWQLETTLRLAANVCNQVSKHINLRADFNCLIDAGEPDPEKQKTVILMRDAGLISAETARNWIGVEDAAAEAKRIEGEAGNDDPSKPKTEQEEMKPETSSPATADLVQ
jgi:hypothetical protein